MHLSERQLAKLNGAILIQPPDPVIEHLDRLEHMLINLSMQLNFLVQAVSGLPVPQAADLSPVMELLARIEQTLTALAQPVSYVFDIERDAKGKMTRVVATKSSKTVLMGV